eukprot:jgi/Tetstr1/423124/TSEL_013893.t1
MPPRPVPEDALVDDAPGGATAASIAELEKRLTAQAEALEKRLAEQFEAATAALLARLAPPVLSPPPKGTQPAIPAGAPTPEGGEQGAQEPLPAELDALDTELEYVDFAYFGQVPPSGLEPPPRDGDEPRLWILTGDDTELAKRLTAQAIALEERLAKQFEAATAALLDWLLPCYRRLPKAPSQPFPRARLRPRVVSKERKSPFLLSWTHSTPSSIQCTVPGPPVPRTAPAPGLWSALDGVDGGRAPPSCRPLSGAGLPTKFWSVSLLEPSAAWSFSATPTDWLRDARLAAGAQPPPSVAWASHRSPMKGSPAARGFSSSRSHIPLILRGQPEVGALSKRPASIHLRGSPAAGAVGVPVREGCVDRFVGTRRRRFGCRLATSTSLSVTRLSYCGAWLSISRFFCMSGLLITGLTVEAFERTGRVDVLGFWSRRIARLFPALFVLVGAISLSRLFRTEDEVQLWMERSDMWWALGYLTNVNLVFFRKDDYFTASSRPSITRHLWTLSIEEQYYFAWPLLFVLWTRLFAHSRKPASSAEKSLLSGPDKGDAVRFRSCVRALAVGECVVMALSYLSSVWTIRQLGLSAAYYSTLCRAGDFAAGGLVYCLIRLSPAIYPRYSQQPGLPPMSTAFRVKLELGSLASLALLLLTPMVPGKPEDVLPWYFYLFRIPYGLVVMGTCFHWPIIVYLGTPVDHETFGSEAAAAADGGSAPLLRNVGIFLLPIALSAVSFWLVEKPLMVAARKHSKAPGKVIAAGLAGALLTAALVGVSYADVRNPYTDAAKGGDREAVLGLAATHAAAPTQAIQPAKSSVTAIIKADLDGMREVAIQPVRAADTLRVRPEQRARHMGISLRRRSGSQRRYSSRFTPLTLLSGKHSYQLLSGILDAHTIPRTAPLCPGEHFDHPWRCIRDNPQALLERMASMQPPGAVIVVCDTLTSLSPCDFGPWKDGTRWVWLRSPVLCREVPLNRQKPADVTRRCPDALHISALEMGGMHSDGLVDAVELTHDSGAGDGVVVSPGCQSAQQPGCADVVNLDPEGRTAGGLKAYTGRAILDDIYLMQLMEKLEWVIPGVISRGTQARLQQELKLARERLRTMRVSSPGANPDDGLRVVMMGESVAQRLGGIFQELITASGDCQKERQQARGFPHLKALNLASVGNPLLLYFLECRRELPASAYDSDSLYGVCAQDGTQHKHHTERQQLRMAMALSKPDVLAVHDAVWSTGLPGYAPFLAEAMTNFLKHAMESGVRTVVMMTPSMSSTKKGDMWRRLEADLEVYRAYFHATQCKDGQQGIDVVLLDWHRLTCPGFEELAATSRTCPLGAHGFPNILPDGQHPSGPSGNWLGAQTLSAIMAQYAMDRQGFSTWDAALSNPVSSCLLQQHPPASGDRPLRQLLHVHHVCPAS